MNINFNKEFMQVLERDKINFDKNNYIQII